MSQERESGWVWDAGALRGLLEEAGYDVDASRATTPEGGGVLIARRDRGDDAIVATIDAGGRLRVAVTRTIRETAREVEVGGVPLRLIATVQHGSRLVGTLTGMGQLAALLPDLERLGEDAVGGREATGGGPW